MALFGMSTYETLLIISLCIGGIGAILAALWKFVISIYFIEDVKKNMKWKKNLQSGTRKSKKTPS